MKSIITLFQICILLCGVFGVDADEAKTVMEGESVTLNSDLTEIQGINLILWRFGASGSVIAQIDGEDISYPYLTEIFGGRLQLDHQTGSLTIKNMRTNHTGQYKRQITQNSVTSSMTFSVTVYESPSVIDAYKAEMKTVSETEGDSVTLQTDVTEPHGDELIVWRFGDEGKLIAKCDLETKSSKLYVDTDEKFRDRLQLNHQTGSLTITHTRTTDSGVYTMKINSNKQTLYRRFIITVSDPGLSPGAVAGIVIVVLLLFAAAAAAGLIYYQRKISELERQKVKTVSEGASVTLNTDVTEVHRDDVIEWRFGDGGLLIAAIRAGIPEIYDIDLDEKFLDRLRLDKKTGSLTIKKTRCTDTGLYELKISQDGKIKYKKFNVSVCVNTVSVFMLEGEPVTLKPDTDIQSDDVIEWRFGNEGPVIAEISGGTLKTHDDAADGRFRFRLKLDETTGSLTITDTNVKQHAGVYQLQITSNRGDTDKKFKVDLEKRKISVREGKNLILNPETEIQKDDQILWRFEDILIAEIRGGTLKTHDDAADGRFRGRLKLDEKTGSLIITDMRTEHTGDYKLQIISSRGNKITRFVVTVYLRNITVEEGKSMTVKPKVEIQTNDQIQWMFEDKVILKADIRGETVQTHDDAVADGRFKGRLKLDEKTGSLIITNMRNEDSGEYKLQIISSEETTNKRFVVTVSGKTVLKSEGASVTLNTNTEIQSDDLIQWRFGDRGLLIAKIERGVILIYDDEANGKFRDRLTLDKKTGSLTIKNTRTTDSGDYKLKKINSSGGVSYKAFRIYVRGVYDKKYTTHLDSGDDNHYSDPGEENHYSDPGDDNHSLDSEGYVTFPESEGYVTFPESGGYAKKYTTHLDSEGYVTFPESGDDNHYSDPGDDNHYSDSVNISVEEGKNRILNPETEIQKDDLILWRFRGILIAEISGGTLKTHDDADDGIFRDRLKLDEKTGSLIITDMITELTGEYKLQISSSRRNISKRFVVSVSGEDKFSSESVNISVEEGKNLIINPETEIQKDDLILWRFRDILIAEIRGGTLKTHDADDGRFRDRLKLDEKTGSLTITDMTTELTGEYKLQIISSRRNISKRFVVSVSGNRVNDATIEMPPVNEEDLDEENEQEGMRLLEV